MNHRDTRTEFFAWIIDELGAGDDLTTMVDIERESYKIASNGNHEDVAKACAGRDDAQTTEFHIAKGLDVVVCVLQKGHEVHEIQRFEVSGEAEPKYSANRIS